MQVGGYEIGQYVPEKGTVGEPLPGDLGDNRLLRTGLLMEELSQRGHTVTWWTSSYDHTKKEHRPFTGDSQQVRPGYNIRFLKGPAYSRNVGPMRLLNHYMIGRQFRNIAHLETPPDIIIASYPTIELSYYAMRLAYSFGVPGILDVRDLWPDIFIDAIPYPFRFFGRMLLKPLFRRASAAMQQATALIGVSQNYLDWALQYAQRPAGPNDCVITLGHPEPSSKVGERVPSSWGVRDDSSVVLFVGSFGSTYDLNTVIEAARILERRGSRDFQFVLCGDGENGPIWRARAAGVSQVIFTGWLSQTELQTVLARAQIGLLAYRPAAPQGLPNKLFEYMSHGIPILSSLRGEAQDFIKNQNIGESYLAGDPESLVLQLLDMSARSTFKNCSERLRSVFRSHYSANVVYSAYADYIESFGAIDSIIKLG